MTKLNTQQRSELVKRCEKQIIELVLTHTFFANLTLSLKRSYTDEVETMATDGERLLINPEFVKDLLIDAEIRFVLAHEAMHCAMGHPWRLGERDPQIANMAMDYAINLILDEYGKITGDSIKMPAMGLLDPQYADMSWEQIYEKLPKPPKGGGGSGGGKSKSKSKGGMGEVLKGANPIDPVTGKAKSNDDMAAEWKGKAVQAAQSAKMQGNLPGCIDRAVGSYVDPKIPWQDVLRRFLTETVKADYDWMKPDRRFLQDDIYIPDMGEEEACGEIVVAIDTSGSIDGPMLDAFFTELNAIHRDLQPKKVHVVACDARVHNHATFEPDDTIIFSPQGGGGTSFAPVFDWVEAQGIVPKALVYLTDLYGSHWKNTPEYPVMWACWSSETKVPWGEVLPVK